MPLEPLDGPALEAARDAVYWGILVPVCEEVASGREPDADPRLQGRLGGAVALMGRLGWPGSPAGPVALSGAEADVIRRAAVAWQSAALERVRDGVAYPGPEGFSAPRSLVDLAATNALFACIGMPPRR